LVAVELLRRKHGYFPAPADLRACASLASVSRSTVLDSLNITCTEFTSTRARDHLLVTGVTPASEFLKRLHEDDQSQAVHHGRIKSSWKGGS
jgi:hypothetical protein